MQKCKQIIGAIDKIVKNNVGCDVLAHLSGAKALAGG